MRLRQIRVDKLFGLFTHVIPLNLDDRITIIHGPNGFGKTAILRLVAGIFDRNYAALRSIPFQTLTLEFDDGVALRITPAQRAERRPLLTFQYGNEPPATVGEQSVELARHFPIASLDDFIPELSRIGAERWMFIPTREVLMLDDIVERFGDRLPVQFPPMEEPEWLKALRRSLYVRFIESQRLAITAPSSSKHRRRQSVYSPAVLQYADDLAERINSTLARYAELSQSLDRSFPRRLVTLSDVPRLSREEIKLRLSALEKRRTQLTEAGLLSKEEHGALTGPQEIDESKVEVLSVYISDTEQKLDVFNDLFKRIDLFRDLINRRFLFKTMIVDRKEGILFQTRDRTPLAATSLSTGEQHEIVMLYELLFSVALNSLILIDEPEISLHVAWQEEFLNDLARISTISKFDFVVATHSPQIISTRWDLTVELKAPSE